LNAKLLYGIAGLYVNTEHTFIKFNSPSLTSTLLCV